MRLLENRVEHRLQVAGRAVDDLQHLGGRGLLFQRLARLGDEPRVLDRDHRLIGEGAHQLDLPLCERLDPLAREIDNAQRHAFAQQRHTEPSTHLADGDNLAQSVFRIGGEVGNLDRLTRK